MSAHRPRSRAEKGIRNRRVSQYTLANYEAWRKLRSENRAFPVVAWGGGTCRARLAACGSPVSGGHECPGTGSACLTSPSPCLTGHLRRPSRPQSQRVDIRTRNPMLFTTTMTGRGAPILVHADYRLVSDAKPAQIGEPVVPVTNSFTSFRACTTRAQAGRCGGVMRSPGSGSTKPPLPRLSSSRWRIALPIIRATISV